MQDIGELQAVLARMNPVEAKKWMKLCADSGLWVPADRSVLDGEDEDANKEIDEEYPDPA